MSEATHVYRNRDNGRLGEMTEEQAAIWPELLERVDAEPEPVSKAAPARSIKKD